MADKSIGELTPATQITASDLFVLEQSGTAKKLTGQILENWLVSYADGHGGIQSIVKTSTSGLVDTYTVTYADTTTSTYTVTNGAKGDTGDNAYVWFKYATRQPTADVDMHDFVDNWIGIYSGTSTTAPTSYTSYAWFDWKGEQGDTGDAAQLVSATIGYQQSDSGSVVPEGSWTVIVPTPVAGKYLWTRVILTFNSGDPIVFYAVSRYGIDGTGAVSSVNGLSPDANGNILITASDLQTTNNTSIQADLSDLNAAINSVVLQGAKQTITASTNGTSAWFSLTGLTADHVVGNWGMFSDTDCTTPIAENAPPCDLTLETGTNQWRYIIANNSTAFYLRPTFILKQN